MKPDHMQAYCSAMEHLPLRPDLEAHILSSVARPGKPQTRRRLRKTLAAAAAAIALVFAVGLPILNHYDRIALPSAQGRVSAYYTPFAHGGVQSADSLVPMTEEELFQLPGLTPFFGTVEQIRNIRLSFNGDIVYRALAQVRVEEPYCEAVAVGDTVSILLPCSIGRGEVITDTALAASLREGTAGIFMPVAYTPEQYWEQNGARVCLQELAPYGLWDGVRHLFLQQEDGSLRFDRQAYPSLQENASLEEAAAYVREMLP